ncbi:MAG: hypothetical protein KAR79_04090 [Simkaniaceae bacterium]|nr:hypothetical protein [Simkaniaceae bacterium]
MGTAVGQTSNLQGATEQNSCYSFVCDVLERIRSILARFFSSIIEYFTGSGEAVIPPQVAPGISSAVLDRRAAAIQAELRATNTEDRAFWETRMQGLKNNYIVNLSRTRTEDILYSDALQLPQIPAIGHYPDGYDFWETALVVKLPRAQLQAFPEAIQHKFRALDDNALDLFLIVGTDHRFPNRLDRNIVMHSIAYPDLQHGESRHFNAEMGIFDPIGVEASRQSPIAINGFNTHDIFPHPAGGGNMALSPNNARFTVPEGSPISSFATASTLPNGRAVATQVILLHDLENLAAVLISDEVRNQYRSLTENLEAIENSGLAPDVFARIQRMLTFPEITQVHE